MNYWFCIVVYVMHEPNILWLCIAALDAGAPPVVHNGSSFVSGISVADAAPPVASLDIETAKPHFPEVPHSEMAALPPPPSYSDFLSEIATNRPQIPDRELKKKLVVSDIK